MTTKVAAVLFSIWLLGVLHPPAAGAGVGKALAQDNAHVRQAAVVRLSRLWGLAEALAERQTEGPAWNRASLTELVEAARDSRDPQVRYLARKLLHRVPPPSSPKAEVAR